MTTASEQTVAYLEFFRRWDTPLDDRAVKKYAQVVRAAPDYNTFRQMVPAGTEERALFVHFFGSFEEAGGMISDGRMNGNLFFDCWYSMPEAWEKARPYVTFLRQESNNPGLYSQFEWLAEHAVKFWAERKRNPPMWSPLTDEPTSDDTAVSDAFTAGWSSDRDDAARSYVAELERRAPSTEEFMAQMQPGTDDWILFDRLLCAYDQAGTLIKNGILHPSLFFRSWRRPGEFWPMIGPWIECLRRERNAPHLYDNIDWLVEYEKQSNWSSSPTA